MKISFFITLFLFFTQPFFAQINDNQYAKFYKDSTYYLIGDLVNIRSKPDTNGAIIDYLKIGEKVTIVEPLFKNTYTLKGYEACWYKIKYTNNNGENKTGYVWGGMLASMAIKSIVDKNILLLFSPSKVGNTEFYNEIYIQVRLCKNNVQLAKLEIKAVGKLTTSLNIKSLGNKGVEKIEDIFRIEFNDEFCAGAFADAYFFWNGKTLYHVKTLIKGFDAPYFSTNEFIFPTDSLGKKGVILNIIESGFYTNNDSIEIENSEKIMYKWNGTRLIKNKTEKKTKEF